MEFSINLIDKLGMIYPESDRLFGITSMWSKYVEVLQPDNSTLSELKIFPIKLEKCNSKHFSDPSLIPPMKWINNSFCLHPNQNFNLSKPFGHPNFSAVLFWIHRCKNSTTKLNCHPPEKIEKDLMNSNVALTFKNYYFDHKKTNNIGMPYVYTEAPVASTTNYRNVRYTFNEVEYTIDNGLIFSNTEVNHYVTFNNLRETIDFRTDPIIPGAFVAMTFNMNFLKKKISKNYYKFQNMLADLGGLYKAALVILSFINQYFSDKLYYNDVIEKNINSMLEKNNNVKTPGRKNEYSNEIKNTNILNLEQSHNKLLNFSLVNIKSKNLPAKEIYNNNLNRLKIFNTIKVKESMPYKSKESREILNFEKFNLKDIITPMWLHKCKSKSSKKFETHKKFQNFIIKQLDVANLINKLNNLDKILLILSNNKNKKIIEDCINPFYFENNSSSTSTEFLNVKNQILLGINIVNECKQITTEINRDDR